MSLIVQKFGGSSVATTDRVGAVAERILAARAAGHHVVVTVSAMGDTTADLLERAGDVSAAPDPRELDALLSTGERVSAALLAMALQRRGAEAVSLDGGQAGVRTDGNHFNAAVEGVDPARIRTELDAGRVPVITGYQGRAPSGETTTLGLGGSDTTAVALAAALDAARCDICTDVDGVYSADPRVVADAYRLGHVSYTEMIELARHGAAVLNPRSVEYARGHAVPLRVCSTFEPAAPGTLVRSVEPDAGPRAVGVASHDAIVPVRVDDARGRAAALGDRVLDCLGKEDVLLDRTSASGERRELLIAGDDIADRDAFRAELTEVLGSCVSVERERGSVSAVGLGVGEDRALAEGSRRAAERAGIPLYGHYRDDHAVTCVLASATVSQAMQLFHERLDAAPQAA